jgi:hypothetical protein
MTSAQRPEPRRGDRGGIEPPPPTDPLDTIRELASIRDRWAGRQGERRAADLLAARLRAMGRGAAVERFVCRPEYPLTHGIHAALALAGARLGRRRPLPGAALALLSLISTFGDVKTRFHLARRLTPARPSQNVVSQDDGGKPGVLVLVAHYDAARTGLIYHPKSIERRAKVGRRLGREIGPFEPFFWAVAAVCGTSAARVLGARGRLVRGIETLASALLAASLPLFGDVQRNQIVPGANDNASGVATVLALAERYGGRLRNWDVWVLLTGAEEGMLLGMRDWLAARRSQLDPDRTVFLNVDMAGYGDVRYMTAEGLVFPRRYDERLVELCDQIASADSEGRFHARRMVSRLATDACVAAAEGYPAIRISCLNELGFAPEYHQPSDTPERLDPAAVRRAIGFCGELIERVDASFDPDLSTRGAP